MNGAVSHKLRPNWLSVALALALTLPGCSGVRSGNSFTGPLPSSAAIGISWDASERMSALYPPGHTALYLTYPGEDKQQAGSTIFGELFENNLRSNGFRIVPVAGGSVPQVSWTVDALGDTNPPSSWYLRLKVADKDGMRTLSRVYDSQGMPQGGFAEGRVE